MELRLGISLQNDVLSNLGDTWLLESAPSLGGAGTGIVMIGGLKNPERFGRVLQRIEDVLAPRSKANAWEETQKHPALQKLATSQGSISYIQLPGHWPVAPAWASQNNQLILAAWPQVAQMILERAKREDLPGQQAFQTSLKSISGKPTVLVYLNDPAILDQHYGWLLRNWTDLANRYRRQGIACRGDWLPSLALLDRYAGPSILGISVDETGMLVEDYGWIGVIPSVLAGNLAYKRLSPPPEIHSSTGGQMLEGLLDRLEQWPTNPAAAASEPEGQNSPKAALPNQGDSQPARQ